MCPSRPQAFEFAAKEVNQQGRSKNLSYTIVTERIERLSAEDKYRLSTLRSDIRKALTGPATADRADDLGYAPRSPIE